MTEAVWRGDCFGDSLSSGANQWIGTIRLENWTVRLTPRSLERQGDSSDRSPEPASRRHAIGARHGSDFRRTTGLRTHLEASARDDTRHVSISGLPPEAQRYPPAGVRTVPVRSEERRETPFQTMASIARVGLVVEPGLGPVRSLRPSRRRAARAPSMQVDATAFGAVSCGLAPGAGYGRRLRRLENVAPPLNDYTTGRKPSARRT
jgi:hypothetical protein